MKFYPAFLLKRISFPRLISIRMGLVVAAMARECLAGDTYLTGAILHPVVGPALTNATLRITPEGRIAGLGNDTPASDGKIVSLTGLHLFPGLIASTTTLGLIEIQSVRATVDTTEVGEFTPELQAWQAVNPDSEMLPVTRANGITHAEVFPSGAPIAGYSSVMQLTGWTIEQLAVRHLAALHVSWPSFSLDLAPQRVRGEGWKSLEDQVKERNERIRELDEYFDQAEAYLKAGDSNENPGDHVNTPAWEAMRPALRGQLPIFIHADEVPQIKSAVQWLTRRRLHGAIVGGRDAARCASLLATNRISVIYTREFALPPRDTDPYDVQFTTPARLTKAGVRVIFGDGDESASFVRNLPYVAAQAVAFGLSHEEALKALTLYPATLFGLESVLGSLEVGKEATMVAADGDILDPKTSVKRMWIAGREVDLASRHTRLYERYRQRPKP